ncbi:hypothetical protein [Botrimarina sp.]|uniref:hypothetical protein n=1 Tax=Botrimarina sp. TaxID=2795802 RepID=UPI0032EE7E1D
MSRLTNSIGGTTKRSSATRIALAATIALASVGLTQAAEQSPDPEAVIAGIDGRVDAYFRAEAGQPLIRGEIRPPFGPGRGKYAREYSYSIVGFAARCLSLGENLEEANAALAENAKHYLDNASGINDRDSFHWHADTVMRLVDMYGTDGSAAAGRITSEAEEYLLRPIWLYVSESASLEKADYKESATWRLYGSENHHAMDFTLNWHFAKLAKDRPEYQSLKCKDGATLGELYAALNEYFVAYAVERAKKGPFIEMMNSHYFTATTRGYYNFYDFGEPRVRRAAGMLLDVAWTYWAEEQIDGRMAAGGSRVPFYEALQANLERGTAPAAWLFFGMGERPEVYGGNINSALTGYRPPPVVADIALDIAGRGRYEVRQRAQGLGEVTFPHGERRNDLRTDGGGVVRYSYCDPAFIMACPMSEARPRSDWAAISSQSRTYGVIFSGDNDTRIIPIARGTANNRNLNAQWAVQSKGTLITQKLKDNRDTAEMLVWFPKEGMSEPVQIDDVVLVEAANAFAAIRTTAGGFCWTDPTYVTHKIEGIVYETRPGHSLTPEDEYAPVIVEVMAKSDVTDFNALQDLVLSREPRLKGAVVHYETIYGDQLTLDTSYATPQTINGSPVDFSPAETLNSPFLHADYNVGVVTIRKGNRQRVLDFASLLTPCSN